MKIIFFHIFLLLGISGFTQDNVLSLNNKFSGVWWISDGKEFKKTKDEEILNWNGEFIHQDKYVLMLDLSRNSFSCSSWPGPYKIVSFTEKSDHVYHISINFDYPPLGTIKYIIIWRDNGTFYITPMDYSKDHLFPIDNNYIYYPVGGPALANFENNE